MIFLTLNPTNQVSSRRKAGIYRSDSGFSSLRMFMVLTAVSICACAVAAVLQNSVRTTSPHGTGFDMPCSNCHSTAGWKPILPSPDFDHDSTGFPLKGMHAGVDCRHCHIDLNFSEIGTQCAECHADIHRRQLGPDCEECHSLRGWREIARNITGHTNRFPLIGAHAALECEACHTSAAVGLFRGLRTDCDSCHRRDYVQATSVDHQKAGFSLNCELCHNMDGWFAGFNHGAFTGFPLLGSHASLDCLDCHEGGNFTGTPADCIACHREDYNNTTDPNHVEAAFSEDCSLCHSTVSWLGAAFDHSGTQFPLTGAHTTMQCRDCHSSGQYAGLPSDCYACHAGDYNNTTNPGHSAAAFPQDCTECHSTVSWLDAVFDHAATQFPLTGAHTTLQCQDCHGSGQYAGLPSDCYACHAEDYNNTTDPVHSAAAFPQDCTECHSTSRWEGAVFEHTVFPIYSGAHRGRWTACSDCHTNSSNYLVFSCLISCHGKTETDSHHREVSGYVYNSTNCYSCHTNGRADD